MYKWKNLVLVLGFFVVLFCVNDTVSASGHVVFQIEVTPGFAVSIPDILVFAPAAPGQTVYQDLSITVWSNVGWELIVSSPGDVLGEDGSPTSLQSGLEVGGGSGNWFALTNNGRVIRIDLPPTGPEGTQLSVPFRFTSDFSDAPGVYTIDVQFTVVPEI